MSSARIYPSVGHVIIIVRYTFKCIGQALSLCRKLTPESAQQHAGPESKEPDSVNRVTGFSSPDVTSVCRTRLTGAGNGIASVSQPSSLDFAWRTRRDFPRVGFRRIENGWMERVLFWLRSLMNIMKTDALLSCGAM